MTNVGLNILTVVILYVASCCGKFVIGLVRGFRFEANCWPFGGRRVPGCIKSGEEDDQPQLQRHHQQHEQQNQTQQQQTQKQKSCGSRLRLPLQIGMLAAGCIIRNCLPKTFVAYYPERAMGWVRDVCLNVILLRAGLHMQGQHLRPTTFLVGLGPPLVECCTVAGLAMTIFGMSTTMSFGLGFVMCALSPAIAIPLTIELHNEGFGTAKCIPSTLVASTLVNAVLSVVFYTLCATLVSREIGVKERTGIQDTSASVVVTAKLLGGFFAGVLFAQAMRCLSHHTAGKQVAAMLAVVSLFVFLDVFFDLQGADLIGVLVYAHTCKQAWALPTRPNVRTQLVAHLVTLWGWLEPLLFGTLGAAIDLSVLHPNIVAYGVYITLAGVAARIVVCVVLMWLPQAYTFKERVLIAFSGVSKATLQAVLGTQLYEITHSRGTDVPHAKEDGVRVLTVCAVSVMLCAPIGAILTSTFGRILLKKQKDDVLAVLHKISSRSQNERRWDMMRIYFFDFVQRRREFEGSAAFVIMPDEIRNRLYSPTALLNVLRLYQEQHEMNRENVIREFLEYQKVNRFAALMAIYQPFCIAQETTRGGGGGNGITARGGGGGNVVTARGGGGGGGSSITARGGVGGGGGSGVTARPVQSLQIALQYPEPDTINPTPNVNRKTTPNKQTSQQKYIVHDARAQGVDTQNRPTSTRTARQKNKNQDTQPPPHDAERAPGQAQLNEAPPQVKKSAPKVEKNDEKHQPHSRVYEGIENERAVHHRATIGVASGQYLVQHAANGDNELPLDQNDDERAEDAPSKKPPSTKRDNPAQTDRVILILDGRAVAYPAHKLEKLKKLRGVTLEPK